MIAILYLIGILFTFYILYVVVDIFLIPTIYIIKDKIGLTDDQTGALTSFVSSAPELSVSLISLILAIRANDEQAFQNIASLGPASVIGSALFSVLFIVGASAWFAGKKLTWHSVTRDMLYYIFAVATLYLTMKDGKIEWFEGFLLLALYVVYATIVANWPKIAKYINIEGTTVIDEIVKEQEEQLIHIRDQEWNMINAIPKIFSYFFNTLKQGFSTLPVIWNTLFAIFLVVVSSYYMVEWASALATAMNIPKALIGLTILAAGTSVPDLLASIKTAREGYADTAVTNAIGSNVFDVLGNLGLTWTIGSLFRGFDRPISVDSASLDSSIILLIASSSVLLLVLFAKKFNLSKPISIFLMLSYVAYVTYLCIINIK
jgi:K+-dependent Na+/Ca+ exchanger-like protein